MSSIRLVLIVNVENSQTRKQSYERSRGPSELPNVGKEGRIWKEGKEGQNFAPYKENTYRLQATAVLKLNAKIPVNTRFCFP